MLIDLPDELGQEKILQDACFKDSIEHLLTAHRFGQHYIVARRELLRKLQALPFSDRTKDFLKKLVQKATETDVILKQYPEHLRVLPTKDVPIHRDGNALCVPYNWFEIPGRVSATRLIGEDIAVDVKIFEKLAENYRASQHIQFSLQGGGGDRTGASMAAASQDAIVIAIVDKDQKSPQNSHGETCAKAVKEGAALGAWMDPITVSSPERKSHQAIIRLMILEARELENLIPIEIWEMALKDPKQRTELKTLFATFEKDSLWIDLKEGILCRKTTGTGAEAKWLRKYVESPCTQACQKNLKDCHEKRINGLGNKALSDVVSWLEQKDNKIPLTNPELNRIAGSLAAWGLAAKPTRL